MATYMSKGKRWAVQERTLKPTPTDLAWVAGFIEGDGYIGKNRTTLEVSATQKESWPLERLQAFFGGSLGQIHHQGISKQTYFRWRISGQRAKHCINAIFPLMSPKRMEQIIHATTP